MSADGKRVAFESSANNLVLPVVQAVSDQHRQVFVRDVATETTWLVSTDDVGHLLSGSSSFPSLDSDGARVAFVWTPTIDDYGRPAPSKVLVRDWQSNRTFDVPRPAGTQDCRVIQPSLSGNGQVVAYTLTCGDSPGDGSLWGWGYAQPVLADLGSGQADIIPPGTDEFIGGDATDLHLDADGGTLVFVSPAWNVDVRDNDTYPDAFVFPRGTASAQVLCGSSGWPRYSPVGDSWEGILGISLSPDGHHVAFASSSSSIDGPPTQREAGSFATDVYLADLASDSCSRVAQSAMDPSLSADGQRVVMRGQAAWILDWSATGGLTKVDRAPIANRAIAFVQASAVTSRLLFESSPEIVDGFSPPQELLVSDGLAGPFHRIDVAQDSTATTTVSLVRIREAGPGQTSYDEVSGVAFGNGRHHIPLKVPADWTGAILLRVSARDARQFREFTQDIRF
jgi:Tol biopolymer transport system component